MTKLLLSVHVLAAILAIGPIAVAASLFPRFARDSGDSGDARKPDDRKPDDREPDARRGPAIAAFLHRICRGYTVVGLAVPVFGLATGAQLGVLGDAWLITSIVLTTIAAALLALAILPTQQRLLAAPDGTDTAENTRAAATTRLAMTTGIFNLLWAIVVVLMIVRPGSTTGA
ncbi:hypothetical protein SBI_04445 [Streptomyces bingchenggensis BCW-1]|uniref:Integral membrane protein n=1 Tax=Streptomyces bingchenggensis (strain BCW-1) TaxID=749414 RepID=D7BVG4_STRBB|nr:MULTISPECIES: membrane protein [Streptomyces]ADI07565.1 hypothetical protein SBI_04445 [Streptomyces bingchenggensis BCW-1]